MPSPPGDPACYFETDNPSCLCFDATESDSNVAQAKHSFCVGIILLCHSAIFTTQLLLLYSLLLFLFKRKSQVLIKRSTKTNCNNSFKAMSAFESLGCMIIKGLVPLGFPNANPTLPRPLPVNLIPPPTLTLIGLVPREWALEAYEVANEYD